MPLAKNALRKLRTLRHPGVVKILDSAETETYIYIATERVTPLSWHVRREALNTETIKWGLHSTAVSLSLFLSLIAIGNSWELNKGVLGLFRSL